MEARAATHPSADTLRSFSQGLLDDATADSVTTHLQYCVECQKEVAAATNWIVDDHRPAHRPSGTPIPDSRTPGVAGSLYATLPPSATPVSIPDLPSELVNHPQYEV